MLTMAKVWLILVLIVPGNGLLFSQQPLALTPEQQRQFDSLKITVRGPQVPVITESGIEWRFNPTSFVWSASKGNKKFGEPDFLRTVGLDKEALDSQLRQIEKSALEIGGTMALLAGVGVLIWTFSPHTISNEWGYLTTDPNFETLPYLAVGTAITVGGVTLAVIGVNMPENTMPYGRAESLANAYNVELMLKITDTSRGDMGFPDLGSL
jgi:hypothetical protein